MPIPDIFDLLSRELYAELDLGVYDGIRIKCGDTTITFSKDEVVQLAYLLKFLGESPSRLVEIISTYSR